MKQAIWIVVMVTGLAGCTTYSGPFDLTAMLADSSIYEASPPDQTVKLLVGDQQTAVAAEAIVTLLEDQVQAWNRGDLDGFMRHYWRSKNLIFVSDGNLLSGWQAVMDRYRQRYATKEQMGSLTFTGLRVFIAPPASARSNTSDAAYAAGRWQVIASDVTRQGSFALVFEKIDGAWKIVLDETTSDP